MSRTSIGLVALLSLSAGPALAQGENSEGLYVGVGLGDFSTDVDSLEDVGDADLDFDEDEDATRVFAGWRFNDFVAVQLDYTDFGTSTAATDLLDVTTDTRGLTPSVVGTLPLGPIELFGRAGVLFYDLEIDTPAGELVDSSSEDAVVAAGIGGTLFETLSLRLEYERIDIEELDDADAVWLTGAWRF